MRAIIISLVLSVLVMPLMASADNVKQVTLYCQAPNSECDAAASHLEGLGIDYRHVYAWSNDRSLHEVERLESVYGIRLDGSSAIFKVNDSIGVGISSFQRIWNFVRRL